MNNKFSYTLLSEGLDLDGRIGTLLYKPSYPINAPTTRLDLELSRYLTGAIKKNPEKYLDIKFTSTNQDMKYDSNPFKLKRFSPGSSSDIPEHFVLEIVSEASPKKVVKTHLDGTEYIEYKRRYIKPKFYKRYMECVTTMMMVDLPASVKIVLPRAELL